MDPQESTASIVIRDAYVVTMDAARTEHRRGYVVVEGNRITEVGGGRTGRIRPRHDRRRQRMRADTR